MLHNYVLLMVWWLFYKPWSWWWSFSSWLLLQDVLTLFLLREKLNLPSACKQKVLEHLHCSSRTHSGSVRYSIRGLNQNPSMSSLSLFFGLVPRSSSECHACVSEGSTHDSECVQSATAEGAVHDVLSHLACYQNTFFIFTHHRGLWALCSSREFSAVPLNPWNPKNLSWFDTVRH